MLSMFSLCVGVCRMLGRETRLKSAPMRKSTHVVVARQPFAEIKAQLIHCGETVS